jgi:hypothetical protein
MKASRGVDEKKEEFFGPWERSRKGFARRSTLDQGWLVDRDGDGDGDAS